MSKNTRNRILLTAVAALLLVTLTIGGTLAWLTAESTAVTNTFTTSKVGVELKENENVVYQMVPGCTIDKDPKVNLTADSLESWVFVKITKSANFDTYMTYTANTGWALVESNDNEAVYVYTTPMTTTTPAVPVLLNNKVTVLDGVTSEQMKNAETNAPTLTLQAYAIQTANLSVGEAPNVTEITADNIEANAGAVWALIN